jgi:hypothetical protein
LIHLVSQRPSGDIAPSAPDGSCSTIVSCPAAISHRSRSCPPPLVDLDMKSARSSRLADAIESFRDAGKVRSRATFK